MGFEPLLRVSHGVMMLSFAASSYVATLAGHALHLSPDNVAALWLTHALLLVALLVRPYREWWRFLTLSTVAQAAANFTLYPAGESWAGIASLGGLGANLLEAVIGAVLVRRYLSSPSDLLTLRGLFRFLLGACCVASLLGAIAGVATSQFIYPDTPRLTLFVRWVSGNAIGTALLAPTLLSWLALAPCSTNRRPKPRLEGIAFICIASAAPLYIFFLPPKAAAGILDLPYALFPFLFWAIVRFHARAALTLCLFTAVAAAAGTAYGLGPFVAHGGSVPNGAAPLQLFLAVMALGVLIVCALTQEREQAELAVRTSEARYRRLFEAAPVGLTEHDWSGAKALVDQLRSKGIDDILGHLRQYPDVIQRRADIIDILDVNEERVRMAGARDKAEYIRALQLLPISEWDAALFDRIARFAAGERRVTLETDGRRMNGERYPLRLTSEIVSDDLENWSRVYTMAQDLTEAKAAEARSLENEAVFRTALDAAGSGGWDWHIETGVLQFSDRAIQLCRYRPEEVEHTVEFLLTIVHPKDRSRFRQAYIAHAMGKVPFYECNYRLRCGDGRYRWIESRGAIVSRDAAGQALRMVGVNADITARKLAEAALKDSEKRHRALVEGSLQGIVILDAEDHCVFANTTLATMLGYERAQELLDQTLYDRITKRDLARIQRFRQARRQGDTAPNRYEVQGIRQDGTHCWLEVLFSPLTWEGQPARMATVIDISERKQLEQELINLSEYEQRRLGQELHDDLGQLLTGIALESRMLADDLTEQGRPEAAAATQVADWVYQALGKAHNVAHGLYPEALASQGFTQALESLAVKTERLFGLTCKVIGRFPDDLIASSDALHLYRIAQEAVTNAAKHGRATVVTLQAEATLEHLRLSVRDNGVGIPAHPDIDAGMGLRNMHTRAATLGATLEIKRHPEGGTEVSCAIPLDTNVLI